ncbi:hypothetical protein BH10PAT2_BH10PAT2_0320 [soil metagenome]
MPISQDQNEYAEKMLKQMKKAGIRVENMNESESMQNRIRKAEKFKTPYIAVFGKKEVAAGTISIRRRGGKNDGEWTVEQFIEKVLKEVEAKARW